VTKPSRRNSGAAKRAPLLVWVFAPFVETDDPNLACYNDYEQSRAEFASAFADLDCEWRWIAVTMANYRQVIDTVIAESKGRRPVVLNLCDGDETNGSPGISVIRYLDEKGLTYTGADERFYDVTTSKIVMKEAFDRAGVPTAAWEVVPKSARYAKHVDGIFDRVGSPLILKPAISAGSMGVTNKSVVDANRELLRQVQLLRNGYRGWDLAGGGIFVEQFISGFEFTTFIIGSYDAPGEAIVYPPVERVFHPGLPHTEQFLSFDRLWQIYEVEQPIGDNEDLWTYQPPPAELLQQISDVSWAAYAAVEGKGYGRVDLRMDRETGLLYVLEVNAQCGLSEDENYTSIGAILRYAKSPFSQAVKAIIDESLRSNERTGVRSKARSKARSNAA
jgi:D-alanine-D-alanine ligase